MLFFYSRKFYKLRSTSQNVTRNLVVNLLSLLGMSRRINGLIPLWLDVSVRNMVGFSFLLANSFYFKNIYYKIVHLCCSFGCESCLCSIHVFLKKMKMFTALFMMVMMRRKRRRGRGRGKEKGGLMVI